VIVRAVGAPLCTLPRLLLRPLPSVECARAGKAPAQDNFESAPAPSNYRAVRHLSSPSRALGVPGVRVEMLASTLDLAVSCGINMEAIEDILDGFHICLSFTGCFFWCMVNELNRRGGVNCGPPSPALPQSYPMILRRCAHFTRLSVVFSGVVITIESVGRTDGNPYVWLTPTLLIPSK
jgi:hypothetical protein